MKDEAALIERSRRGDAAAFGRLVRGYEDRIFRMASHVCAGMPSEAEDVHQETFVTAFKSIGRFRGGSSLSTWLYRIASNLCWMRFRGRRRSPVKGRLDGPGSPGEGVRDWRPSPEEAAKKKELRAVVTRALSELPVDYRLVVTLRDVEGLSNKETAKVLGLKVPAVKSRLHRGRMFLRDRLDAYFNDR